MSWISAGGRVDDRDLVDTLAVTRRFGLTGAQWQRPEPLLPMPSRPGRPSLWGKRHLIGGVRWRVRTGAPWRDMRRSTGAYGLCRCWQRSDAWRRILIVLHVVADADGQITWDVSVDSTILRAHQHASGAWKGDLQAELPGGIATEPEDHALGRSRGGLTTKLHLSCERGQKPLSIVLTAGHRHDSPQFIPVPQGAKCLG